MAEDPKPHNIDVGIRTLVMLAARKRLNQVRKCEKLKHGVPVTTMASLGRDILMGWTPEATKPAGKVQGIPIDSAGNLLTKRGHRKYRRNSLDAPPERGPDMTDDQRAQQLAEHLRRVSDPARGTTLGPIGAVKKVARLEGLMNIVVDGKELRRHIGAAERRVLKPLRFTLPEDVYEHVSARLDAHGCTVTRALEVGLEEFARTGEIKNPKG